MKNIVEAVMIKKGIEYTPSSLYENAIIETPHKYNEILFDSNSAIFLGCLNELPAIEEIDRNIY